MTVLWPTSRLKLPSLVRLGRCNKTYVSRKWVLRTRSRFARSTEERSSIRCSGTQTCKEKTLTTVKPDPNTNLRGFRRKRGPNKCHLVVSWASVLLSLSHSTRVSLIRAKRCHWPKRSPMSRPEETTPRSFLSVLLTSHVHSITPCSITVCRSRRLIASVKYRVLRPTHSRCELSLSTQLSKARQPVSQEGRVLRAPSRRP